MRELRAQVVLVAGAGALTAIGLLTWYGGACDTTFLVAGLVLLLIGFLAARLRLGRGE
jgi:hypothetical protein